MKLYTKREGICANGISTRAENLLEWRENLYDA